MPYSQLSGSNRRFTFSCENLAKNTFEVVRFEGEEALSSLYRFELLLAVADHSYLDESRIDSQIIGRPALFTLNDGIPGGKPTRYHGLVQDFSYAYQTTGWTLYRAVLVPKMWRLTAYHRSEVYINKNPNEIFKLILENSGLISTDVEWRQPRDRQNFLIDYICQYKESNYDFIERWADRVGDYWWYEENGDSEKIVFTHSLMAHKYEALQLSYLPDGNHVGTNEVCGLQSLECETRCLPEKITVMDYFYETSDLPIVFEVDVDKNNGIGEVFLYGQNLRSIDVAKKVAELHAEILRCRAKQYSGRSGATGLRCGHLLDIIGHPRGSYNQRYLLTRVQHCGSQAIALLELGLSVPASAQEKSANVDFYRADFSAIPSIVQFRSEIRRPWPKIEGTLTAFIDAEGGGEYAELNENGEYKVRMPFVGTDKIACKCSAWIRKSSENAGKGGQGMHFPLRKGDEVLLSFINGDPDQPVIIGAVPNSLNRSVVDDKNQTQSRLQTATGNMLVFEDKTGNESVKLKSADKNVITLGSTKDAEKGIDLTSEGIIRFKGKSKEEIYDTGQSTSWIKGPSTSFQWGAALSVMLGQKVDVTPSSLSYTGVKFDIWSPFKLEGWAGIKAEMWKGMKFEVGEGSKFAKGTAFFVAPTIKLETSEIELLKQGMAVISNSLAAIKEANTEIESSNVRIKSLKTDFIKKEITLEEYVTVLKTQKAIINSANTVIETSTTKLASGTNIFI